MSGAPDLLYVRARAALLDVAEALDEQLDAVVLVGAQAVYLHTGDADFVATGPVHDRRRLLYSASTSEQHAASGRTVDGARVLAR